MRLGSASYLSAAVGEQASMREVALWAQELSSGRLRCTAAGLGRRTKARHNSTDEEVAMTWMKGRQSGEPLLNLIRI